MQRAARMKRELELFLHSPPHGITCFLKQDSISNLEAQILGPEGSPYEKGKFKLDIQLPERYPFEPPKVNFVTPIYHPNIDTAGRICLDSLKMPPKGAWKPALNVCTVLTSIQQLMSEPNPEDPLMTEIANQFKYDKSSFNKQAQEHTLKYAVETFVGKKDNAVSTASDKSTATSLEKYSSDSDESDDENSELVTNTNNMGKRAEKRLSEEGPLVLKDCINKRWKDQ